MCFLAVIHHHQSDYWALGAKFDIDFANKHIVIHDATTTLDIKTELYKPMKQMMSLRDNIGYEYPLRGIGGDTLPNSQFAGDQYFTINGYRVVYDPTNVKVTGILNSDDFDTPWLYSEDTSLSIFPASVSNLALAIEPDLTTLDIPTALENADAVWDKTTEAALINTYGEKMLKLLTVAKYLGLK